MSIVENVLGRIKKTDNLRSKIGKLHQAVAIVAVTIIVSLSVRSIWLDQLTIVLPLLGVIVLIWFAFEFFLVLFMLGENVDSRLDQVTFYAEDLREYCVKKFDLLENTIKADQIIVNSIDIPLAPAIKVSKSGRRSASGDTKERESMHKLIIGMAIECYKYNPTSKYNDAIEIILADLKKYELYMIDDTVRKHLKESADAVLSQGIIDILKKQVKITKITAVE